MRRFSVRALMAVIVGCAVGIAALRNANDWWAGTMLQVALTAVGIAVLGAIFVRGREQAWWLGFALFGGGYLVLAVSPWLINTFQPILCTTHVLRALQSHVVQATSDDEVDLQQWRAKRDELAARLREAESLARSGSDPDVIAGKRALVKWYQQFEAFKDAANDEEFQQIGHSLFSLLAGLMGGAVAVWFYLRSLHSARKRCDV